ncbi:hypothetical protein LSTR_LSTR004863 [Laodelphax striatellus]|uniref:Peroxisomal ATPase PEX6 n=1 Tax=Laodelphax striatellus TaxID=195883 RepID=A0A482WI36_LAOST|nr:hypothetical protein LSTR_LSTR004863 [Laodelphax striatellus]
MLEFAGSDICIVPATGFVYILNNITEKSSLRKLIHLNTIIVGNQYFKDFGNGGWYDVQLSIEYEEAISTEEIFVHRTMQVLCFPAFKSDKIIMSEEDLFNAIKNENPPFNIPYLSIKFLSLNSVMSNPQKADQVKLCSLKTLIDEDFPIIDSLLEKFFKTTKYLFEGDVFSIDGTKYFPELILKKKKCYSANFYFLVCEAIKTDENESSNHRTGYIVDDTVTMYQITTKNFFLPPKYNLFLEDRTFNISFESEKFLLNLLPLSLKHYLLDLKTMFRPFLVQGLKEIGLNPLFLISGASGCGKSLLLETLAGNLGINYQKISCSRSLNGTFTRYNEAKLKELFSRIVNYCPCVVQLDNFQSLGMGSDGHEDVRLIATFKMLMQDLQSLRFPVFIVGTTTESIDSIPNDLVQLVLQTVNIISPNGNRPETITERSETIKWLCYANYHITHIDPDVIEDLSRCTSGFTLRDLSYLLSSGIKNAYSKCEERIPTEIFKSISFDNFSKTIDQMNAESAEEVGAPKIPRVNWADVGGHNQIKKEIVRSINGSGFSNELKRSGLLLWGPPGTGKTLLAKAVATECGSSFLSVKGPELLNKYIGQSEENVRQIFEKARQSAPCIIFFDELDSLAPNRGRSGDSGGVMDRVVSQLLSEMDGLQSNEQVFVLGATNRPDLIDAALLRPGRLDKMLYVGPCQDIESKVKVLEALTRKFQMSAAIELETIARHLPPQLTGADLYSVCYGAWQNAAKNLIKNNEIDLKNNSKNTSNLIVKVTDEDFRAAMEQLQSSN